jgi:transcriptional regulator with GAF, ATPase, and Fis domain
MRQSEAEPLVKVCTICNEEKLLEDFTIDPRFRDGRRNQCKCCINERLRYKREHNIDDFKGKRNRRLQKHRKTLRGCLQQRLISAKMRDSNCSITIEDVEDQYLKQNGRCNLSGLPLVTDGSHWEVLSLDRIDSSRGYEKGNIQLLTNRVNLMKGNMDQLEFLKLCERILKEGSETISKESTLEANAGGSAQHPMDEDIVRSAE